MDHPHDHLDDHFLSIGIAHPVEERAGPSDQQTVIDQVLELIAAHYREVCADLGQPAASPSIAALRQSPIGRDLQFLAAVAQGGHDVTVTEVQERTDRVLALLLRPLATTDFDVPTWFWTTSLGRILAAARYQTHPADDLICAASAAERLNVDRAAIDQLLHHGIIEAIRDDVSRPLISLRSLDRLRLVSAELHGLNWPPDDVSTDDNPVV